MRKLSEKEIIAWLNDYEVASYTLVPDPQWGFVVSVAGSVYLRDKKIKAFPFKFGDVAGYFSCNKNNLKSLIGAPTKVGEQFNCSNNMLTSLRGGPSVVGTSYYCDSNKITSLKGAPKSIIGDFDCSYNNLETLLHSPESVDRSFYCSANRLKDLLGSPASVGEFFCANNKLTTLEGISRVSGTVWSSNNLDLGRYKDITDYETIAILLEEDRQIKQERDRLSTVISADCRKICKL